MGAPDMTLLVALAERSFANEEVRRETGLEVSLLTLRILGRNMIDFGRCVCGGFFVANCGACIGILPVTPIRAESQE